MKAQQSCGEGGAMSETVVDEAKENTLEWAAAMKAWLLEYERHVDELCRTKKLPKPPQW
jgi:hypothetical protein